MQLNPSPHISLNMEFETFGSFFKTATGHEPYPYQTRLACMDDLQNTLLDAPTGSGKTEAAVLAAYLWRRVSATARGGGGGSVPRRLVYCLPMRVLVEQTVSKVQEWIRKTGLQDRFDVVTLMGGDTDTKWRKWPEKEMVIVGTQDMLLSRALNRGYAMNIFQWPAEFGLLNNDCLWVIDEIQLMGNGLATTAQLQAFRSAMGTYGLHRTMWMSATLNPEWLRTVDFDPGSCCRISVADEGGNDSNAGRLTKCLNAPKTLRKISLTFQKNTYGIKAAKEVRKLHVQGTLTLVMVNTVDRAQDLFRNLASLEDNVVLIHSRFRPAERSTLNSELTSISGPDNAGRDLIIVSTQALEAGVDVSARTLITEIAPWPSMVQRIGRCNRYGEHKDGSGVYVTEIPKSECAPYEEEDVEQASGIAASLYNKSVSPAALSSVAFKGSMPYDVVVRRLDLIDLFDTSPDMSGSHTDVSRFVRSSELDTDVGLAWREWTGDEKPPGSKVAGIEVCSVPIGIASRIVRESEAWWFDPLDGSWARARSVYPGQVLVLRSENGGYNAKIGFDLSEKSHVPPPPPLVQDTGSDGGDYHGSDAQSEGGAWVTLNDHTAHVVREMDKILAAETDGEVAEVAAVLRMSAKYHDLGKAHDVFQETMLRADGGCLTAGEIWAKRPRRPGIDRRHRRTNFRHEAVSAVAFLELCLDISQSDADLAAYLIASHHGKVRLSMRTLPRKRRGRYVNTGADYVMGLPPEGRPEEIKVFTSASLTFRGSKESRILDNNVPETVKVDASMARLGTYGTGRSWLQLSLGQLSRLGPFKLAYLEAILRAADSRASADEEVDGAV